MSNIIDRLKRSLANEANQDDPEWHTSYQAERLAFREWMAGPDANTPARYSRSQGKFVPINDK